MTFGRGGRTTLSNVNRPPYLTEQRALPSHPSSSILAEVVCWDYSFTFYDHGNTSFEVVLNEKESRSYSISVHDRDGVGELRVTGDSATVPLVRIAGADTIAVDGAYRFQQQDGSFVPAAALEEWSARMVVLEHLSILDVQSARAVIGSATFPEPLWPRRRSK